MKVREYYEKLAQVRANLREELDKKQVEGKIILWSAEYHHSFKEKMYKEIIDKIKSKAKALILNLGCGGLRGSTRRVG